MSNLIKKSNGKESQSMLIFIHTNKTAKDCHDQVIQWFLKCITPLANLQCKENHQCNLNIISNIQDNDYFDDEEKEKKNTIVIALQNGQTLGPLLSSVQDEDNIIIIDEEPKNYLLKADDILNYLNNEPEYITKYGVSAVSTKCIKNYWSDMISEEPNCFDIPGKGFMLHTQWVFTGEIWGDVRETSYNFGWENYNPE